MKIESGRMLNDYIEPNKKQYCIPVFQRDYAWTEEQCTKLFEDIVMAYKKDNLIFVVLSCMHLWVLKNILIHI